MLLRNLQTASHVVMVIYITWQTMLNCIDIIHSGVVCRRCTSVLHSTQAVQYCSLALTGIGSGGDGAGLHGGVPGSAWEGPQEEGKAGSIMRKAS